MAMDWAGYGDYAVQPMEEIEDEEDFYSEQNHVNGIDQMQTTAGASAVQQPSAVAPANPGATQSNMNATTNSSDEEQRKQEQQKQLDALRKKLMAKRGITARPDTPSKTPVSIEAPPQQHRMEHEENRAATAMATAKEYHPMHDELGIESLLAEGKAAAEAKVVRDKQAAAAAALAVTMKQTANSKQQTAGATTSTNMDLNEVKPAITQEKPAEPTHAVVSTLEKPADHKQTNDTSNLHPVNTNDSYYDDLAIWLEFTGYHDVQFRNSKLRNYKERRELEQEAARIAERLEKLKQAEKADLESLRATIAHSTTATPMAPPPLPYNMPTGDHRQHTNGLKRPHSPEPSTVEKASRKPNDFQGFKIRGVNEASAASPRENDSPLQRRESLPKRRGSINERRERDPSLERRQQYYNSREPLTPGTNGRGGHDQRSNFRDGPRPFNARDRERERDGFSQVNRIGGSPRGPTAGPDLRKGGVRYFMIKSWNHDNVAQAMKDSLWATQEKNQALLTEAYHTSRHVILLFSVNRSMAFQGCALMTSPPDPSLPTPSFCNKLNWATSPAFTLQWLATTAVHFRLVGHLKNTCNPDEEGSPRAVLVGKDGQEISQDAGMGVVLILDEAEEVEGRGRLRDGRE